MSIEYVSFEVAKLLKQKSFYWACHAYYDRDGFLYINPISTINADDEIPDSCIACPTYFMAQRWLREKEDIHIVIECKPDRQYYYKIYYLDAGSLISQSNKCWDSYERTLNEAILEAFKIH